MGYYILYSSALVTASRSPKTPKHPAGTVRARRWWDSQLRRWALLRRRLGHSSRPRAECSASLSPWPSSPALLCSATWAPPLEPGLNRRRCRFLKSTTGATRQRCQVCAGSQQQREQRHHKPRLLALHRSTSLHPACHHTVAAAQPCRRQRAAPAHCMPSCNMPPPHPTLQVPATQMGWLFGQRRSWRGSLKSKKWTGLFQRAAGAQHTTA